MTDGKEKRLQIISLWIIIVAISISQGYQMYLIHQEHYRLQHQILYLNENLMDEEENNLLFRKEVVGILEDCSEHLKSVLDKN